MKIKINKTIYGVVETRNMPDRQGNAKARTVYKLKNRNTVKYLSHDLKRNLFSLMGNQANIVNMTMTFPKPASVVIGI